MKKIFLTLLLMLAATATMAAQDEQEKTAAPIITVEMPDAGIAIVTISNSEEDPEPQLKILNPLKWHSIENPLISLITY